MLIVAVHDVAPSTLSEVRWLLAGLDAAGVNRRVLKVIPHPGDPESDQTRSAALHDLLAAEVSAGSEIVVHGWTHRATGRPLTGSPLDRARARLFAANAAEFLSLAADERRKRLEAGAAWLTELDLMPIGFCPPAWLGSPGLDVAARAAGFRYVAYLRGIRDLRSGGWIYLPPVGYFGVEPFQEHLVQVGAAILAKPLRSMLRAPAYRVVLHPQDARRSAVVRRLLADLAERAHRHRPGTYAELLDG